MGSSVIARGWPSLLEVWARHAQAAQFYGKAWWLKIPRYGWGVFHAWVAAPLLRSAELSLESPPIALATGAVTVAMLYLTHVI